MSRTEPDVPGRRGGLHKTGEHEFLNWMVLSGAVTPAPADVRYFGELGRINLAAVEWRVA